MTETRIEYLERNLAEVRMQRDLLQNKPWGVSISKQDRELSAQECRLQNELWELRPYNVEANGPGFIVAHRGNYVLDANHKSGWLTFDSIEAATDWIAERMGVAA